MDFGEIWWVFALVSLIFSIAVAIWAAELGRVPIGWFFLSLLASPLIGAIILGLAGRTYEAEAVRQYEIEKKLRDIRARDEAELAKEKAELEAKAE